MTRPFADRIHEAIGTSLKPGGIKFMQVNMGSLCNMACGHCHADGGPASREVMEKATVDQVLAVIEQSGIAAIDITGGAPEMNPNFEYLVTEARHNACHVIVRSNLTIFFEDGFGHLPDLFCSNGVEVTASLPCYISSNVDRMRGEGTFEKSIEAMRRLNSLGYGDGSGRLRLNLVYNPSGAFLAPGQKCIEDSYRGELFDQYGIRFDRLLAISNMPIGRFRDQLERTGAFDSYMELLEASFNPSALSGLMCRHLVNVGWDGMLHDCDFNQALGLGLNSPCPTHIAQFDPELILSREVRTGDHCYGCAAGQGST